jgi:protein-S-isoprenylcysteine O-methyltransferase Ste14
VLQIIAVTELVLCWIVWSLAFVKPKKRAERQKEVARAPSSKWGIFLVMVGFLLIWGYVRPAGFQKSALSLLSSMVLAPLSVALVWASTRHLGKQWRYQAAISEGHQLIQTGPYRLIRHPIYASMLGMLLATGTCWTWWPMFLAAVVFFIAGTETRIQAEERLLDEHFPGGFAAYRARTWAYIPFVR